MDELNDIQDYLMVEEREFYDKFENVSEYDLPSWVFGIDEVGFQTARKNRRKRSHPFEEWLKGEDITIINKRKALLLNPPKSDKKNDKKGSNRNTFELLEVENEEIEDKMEISDDESQVDYYMTEWIKNYNAPKTNRSLDILLNDHSVWSMSI